MCFPLRQLISKSPTKLVTPDNGHKQFCPTAEEISQLNSHYDIHLHLVKIWEERGGTPADDFNLELSLEDIKNLRDTIVEGKLPVAFDPAHYEWEVKNRAAQESVFLDAVDTMLRAINDGHYVYYTSWW